MILEGIVTTLSPEGAINIAPMGVLVSDEGLVASSKESPEGPHDSPLTTPRLTTRQSPHFLLRPYQTARTYQNLKQHPEGVLHITDDVLLLARAAIGLDHPLPSLAPAKCVRGSVLKDCCRYFEFCVEEFEDSSERADLHTRLMYSRSVRDFFGFNRAKHAVVEAAILATRVAFLPLDEISAEFARLETIVRKTGGSQEWQAFCLLAEHVSAATKQKLAGAAR